MEFKVNINQDNVAQVFWDNYHAMNDPSIKVIVNRGGTRSAKTFSTLLLDLIDSFDTTKPYRRILYTRQTIPQLKMGIHQDLLSIFRNSTEWFGIDFNKFFEFPKTENTYSGFSFRNIITDTKIVLYPVSNEANLFGVPWDRITMDEAIQNSFEAFLQLSQRSPGQIRLNFNPVEPRPWIRTKIEEQRLNAKGDVKVIKSSYKTNQLLSDTIISEIKYNSSIDPEYKLIYSDGEYPSKANNIYSFETITLKQYESIDYDLIGYGADFGDKDPNVLVEVKFKDGKLYAKELYRKSYSKIDDMIEVMKDLMSQPLADGYGDPNPGGNVRAIRNAGFNFYNADKSVDTGINNVKRWQIHLVQEDVIACEEMTLYKYKADKDGNLIDGSPLKHKDHFCDALRYAVMGIMNKYNIY